jgi:glycosyltransferase involved in cell wall biosynthesis
MPWVLTYYAVQGPALKRIAAALETAIEHELCQVDLVHNGRIGREGLSFASLQLARRRGVPFVLTPVHHPRWGSWLHRYYHRLYREADAVIALTETERQTLVQLGVRERRVFVTGMGPILADAHDGARFRAEFALGDEPLILYLGQKYAYKGLAALLAAAALVWKRHPETRFAFLGPRTAYSQRLFSTVRDERILELDTVSLQTKTDALAACQVLCVPSTQESFGGVYTEAWSLGKPVVAADIPAVRSVVTDGQDGLLVSQAPGAIADALVSLLGKPGLAQQMGLSGRGKVVQRYTWPCLAQQTERVYDHVLRQGR